MALSRRILRAPGRPLARRALPAPVQALRELPRSPFTTGRRCLYEAAQQTIASAGIDFAPRLLDDVPRHLVHPLDTFPRRHIGPSPDAVVRMLATLDPPVASLDEFVRQVVPADIRSAQELSLSPPRVGFDLPRDPIHGGAGEMDMLKLLTAYRQQIQTGVRSYIGCGYYPTVVPPVILRNVLENPAWYTSYTPYQPEISQGRLESLLNFQTLTTDLTGLPIANASVLDEATAAAEAMTMSLATRSRPHQKRPDKAFIVSHRCHPQTIAVMRSRAEGFGIHLIVGDILAEDARLVREHGGRLIGVLAQYPDTEGGIFDWSALGETVHHLGGTFCVATDLLALTVLRAPGEFGADIAFGSAQRLGVPMGFGGPHAAFLACAEEYKRKMPGRLIGVSKDRLGHRALRLALQTREQHIRREKATSNICTAQALLANTSALYAVYHGPDGLKAIAQRIMAMTAWLRDQIRMLGYYVPVWSNVPDGGVLFDTLTVEMPDSMAADAMMTAARHSGLFFRRLTASRIGISLDETVGRDDLRAILQVFDSHAPNDSAVPLDTESGLVSIPANLARTSSFLTQPVFNMYHSETEMLRYIHHLASKDLSLAHSMIPLGSCTMKLNATTEMIPISWPEFSQVHPFLPADTVRGYTHLIEDAERQLADITGMAEVTVQPNSGAQGEFAGLRVVKKYFEAQGGAAAQRNVCLIPVSAHGTNPASAAMAGMRVVPIKCDPQTGNLDLDDLQAQCMKHQDELAAIMITYPSTFGVYEPGVKEACRIVHEHGGQVYMDGANLNAQIGICSPGEIGADVCHLNLHKTFCIPHGGGGPGVGPIGVAAHLRPFLPAHPLSASLQARRGEMASFPVSAAPWGSASILPITFNYINLMGSRGLTYATTITLLSANYLMSRLRPYYPILYTNDRARCAHEFILDVRSFQETSGVEAIDIAKRLQDYGFHAPTMSWPVANTLMIEPTESESLAELDRFCDALIAIRHEIAAVERGEQPRAGNVLKMAPHPQQDLLRSDWDRPYSRETAAYPLPWLREKKFWPSVTRVDDAYGDQNLFCTCGPVETS